ncbi:CHAT domain-containing protein [Methylomonas sp. HW2-6]|uniref:CHAT domain-containing protein n=1 Tax=Methylomonas sp. HW2-6 TaxID=3376687 RepID=UPI004042BEF1
MSGLPPLRHALLAGVLSWVAAGCNLLHSAENLDFPDDAESGAIMTGNWPSQAQRLRELGLREFKQQRYDLALSHYRQALALAHNTEPPEFSGDLFYKIGRSHLKLQQYQQATTAFENGLLQFDAEHENELAILHNMLGTTYRKLGAIDKAGAHLEQALSLRRKLADGLGEARTLGNLGLTYLAQGRYAKALEIYDQAQQRFSGLPEASVRDKGTILSNISAVYAEMGRYDTALAQQRQALAIFEAAEDIDVQADIASAYHNLGYIYAEQKDHQAATKAFEHAIAIRKQLNDRFGVAETQNNLGLTLSEQQQHTPALAVLSSALDVLQQLGTRKPTAATYDSIGSVYARLGQLEPAFSAYLQALAIWRDIGDRDNARITLGNIGALFERQGQQTLAIAFYKQSVNLSERIRKDLKSLPEQDQKAYLARVQGFYRSLADLLLRQDRVIEAQQVLDLLKVQEAADFLGPVRGNETTGQGVAELPAEQDILKNYAALERQAISTGQALAALDKLDRSQRSPEQQKHWQELDRQQRSLQRAFATFIESREIQALIGNLSREARTALPALEQLRSLKDNLARLGTQTVLLYPLVLDDRLEIVLIGTLSPPLHIPVPVDRATLNQAIVELRTALTRRHNDVEQRAQTLYRWLVQPIEPHLHQLGAKTILYAPDGVLRYIPLAALHDGRQWLAQRFNTVNITALSLTELETRPLREPKLLAAAFASGDYDFTLGDRHFDFKGLPFAGLEVNDLAALYPGALKLVDRNFSPAAVLPELNRFNIIHFATHAALVSGKPDESFILFGNGERVTVDQVKYEWSLENVDLIALSACETALGASLGKGEEILGLGFLMENAGARATLASLWSVDDGGTQALMNAFYRALQQPGNTKGDALRQAQLSMITGASGSGSDEGRGVQTSDGDGGVSFSHPYYWAPFILIGNGL